MHGGYFMPKAIAHTGYVATLYSAAAALSVIASIAAWFIGDSLIFATDSSKKAAQVLHPYDRSREVLTALAVHSLSTSDRAQHMDETQSWEGRLSLAALECLGLWANSRVC
eukprot:2290619-Amphidinium_carterae.1